MIGNENDIIEFESCIDDAFYLLEKAVDMIEDDQDHRNLITIRNIIRNKILVHKPYVYTRWLKKTVQEAW